MTMKKIVLGLTFFLAVCSSYAQKDLFEQSAIEEFVQSADFARARNCIKIPGYDIASLAIINSYVKYANDDKTAPVLYVQVGAGRPGSSRLIGEFQVAKVSPNYRAVPNNGRYLILFRDYSAYDVTTSTGVIKYYDLNYDCYLAGVINVQRGIVLEWNANSMPEEIMIKYNFNDYNNAPDKGTHYCDGNKDGDISFGECYRCMVKTCEADPVCRDMCDLINKNGLPVMKAQCRFSMGAACIYLSIKY